jgi:hypothetical protein
MSEQVGIRALSATVRHVAPAQHVSMQGMLECAISVCSNRLWLPGMQPGVADAEERVVVDGQACIQDTTSDISQDYWGWLTMIW